MLTSILTKARIPYLLPFFLVVPALLIHLGSMPLLADEPTRALVALEMFISKNYVVPTIHGEYYYNKPPLYNWLLVGLYHLTGHINEWVIRIPTVISIFFFCSILYFFIQKYTSRKLAFIVALAYVISGRVLFYDSFLGLIDTLFSALIFLNFMLVYHFDQRKQYHYLFILTYVIVAACYMLKGLPGLAFQAITLFSFFVFVKKDFKKLFSLYHFLGIFLFLFLVSLYYIQYLKYNSLETVFKTIVSESSKRTIAETGFLNSITHILIFPFTTLLHFLPSTLPFLLILKKGNFKKTLEHPFLKYCLIVLLANISVYWLSPETEPRYLFMFLPLLLTISYFLYFEEDNKKYRVIFEKILLVLSIIITLIFLTVPFVPVVPEVPFKYLKLFFLVIALIGLTIYYYKNIDDKIIIFCSILLVARIGFDWYVFPSRLKTEVQVNYKNYGIEVAKQTKGKPLYIYLGCFVDHDISFYLERERMEIIKASYAPLKPDTYYITCVFQPGLMQNEVDICYEFYTSYQGTKLYLVKLKR